MVTLRPACDADSGFLLALYASTRTDLARLPDPAIRDQLIAMQAAAQQAHYRARFPRARASLVLDQDGRPVGRLVVDYGADALRLVDISLLPEHCGRGIGAQLLGMLQDQAARAGLPLRLSVAAGNRAIHLYQRLGFQLDPTEGVGMHHYMTWRGTGLPSLL